MYDLFFSSGTGHSIMVLAFIIAIGLLLGKVSIKGISLGSVWILLVGILFGAAGVKADALFLHFIKEFGLVLFVFSIGLQAGPGFFTSFRGEGLKLNMMAILMVLRDLRIPSSSSLESFMYFLSFSRVSILFLTCHFQSFHWASVTSGKSSFLLETAIRLTDYA